MEVSSASSGWTWPKPIRMAGHYALYLVLRVAICLIQLATMERCERWCRLLTRLVSNRWWGVRSALVRENLQRVFPLWSNASFERTNRQMWRHLFLMVCEVAHARRKIHRSNWYEHYRFSDRRKILEVILDPRPKILVTGHCGNFEMAGFINGLFGMPTTTLARPLDNPYIHRYITDFRSEGGQHFLSKDRSANEVQRLLEQGGTLGLLADQDAGKRGCWVKFLGHPASCHKALALFTLVNNAPMMVCYNRRLRHPLQFEIVVLGVTDPAVPAPQLENVQTLTQWYNDCLEEPIRAYPDQYWWLHRRWREPPKRLQRESQRIAEPRRLAS
jgi:Kdo2-lipid IVA lauroyltransferase/acyltransferase